jgi:hypothetical protein
MFRGSSVLLGKCLKEHSVVDIDTGRQKLDRCRIVLQMETLLDTKYVQRVVSFF